MARLDQKALQRVHVRQADALSEARDGQGRSPRKPSAELHGQPAQLAESDEPKVWIRHGNARSQIEDIPGPGSGGFGPRLRAREGAHDAPDPSGREGNHQVDSTGNRESGDELTQ